MEQGFFDDDEPVPTPARTELFDVMPWDEYVPIVSAAFGILVTLHWVYSTCTRDPDETRDKMRRIGQRRGEGCQMAIVPDGALDKWDRAWRKSLPAERYASLRKGETDPPNLPAEEGGISGVMEEGVFSCAGCGTPLYDNEARFEAGCGWPCFFTCLPNAVRERADADGERMELICNACNGHLGHVFRGEKWGFPPPDERHCVNSLSLVFEKTEGGGRYDDPKYVQQPAPYETYGDGPEAGEEEFETGYHKWLRHKAEQEANADLQETAERMQRVEGEGEEFYSYDAPSEDGDAEDEGGENSEDMAAIDD